MGNEFGHPEVYPFSRCIDVHVVRCMLVVCEVACYEVCYVLSSLCELCNGDRLLLPRVKCVEFPKSQNPLAFDHARRRWDLLADGSLHSQLADFDKVGLTCALGSNVDLLSAC